MKSWQCSPSLSETAEPSQRTGAWKTCSSLKWVCFTARRGWHSHPDLHQLLCSPPEQGTALLVQPLPATLPAEFVLVPKGAQMSERGGGTVKCFVIHYTTPLFPGRFGLGWHQVSQSRLLCLASGLCFQQGALCVCSGVLSCCLQALHNTRGGKLQWFPITALLF